MNKTVLEEIIDLKNSFEKGIYWAIYCNQKKILRCKIDLVAEQKINEYTTLLIEHIIDKTEFNEYKMRIENTRQLYKQLLARV